MQPEYVHSFRTLKYILLALILGLLILQLALKQIRPINLLFAGLIYIFIVWQNISSITYRIIIILTLVYTCKQCLNLLYFCFGEQSDLSDKFKSDRKNVIIVIGVWIIIMIYSILLSWRAYQRNKLNQLIENELLMN